MLSWCQGQRRGCSERRASSCSDLLAPHSAQHGAGEKILGKNTYTSLLAAGHIYCIVFVMCSCPHLCAVVVLFFFYGTLHLLNGGAGFHLAVIHYFAFLYWAQFNPCSEGRISHFLQCFQGCHSYLISGHVRNTQMSNGGKRVQTLPEFRRAADCCHSKKKHSQELNLVCFITCGTREDFAQGFHMCLLTGGEY